MDDLQWADETLLGAVATIVSQIRMPDLCFRWEGAEFALRLAAGIAQLGEGEDGAGLLGAAEDDLERPAGERRAGAGVTPALLDWRDLSLHRLRLHRGALRLAGPVGQMTEAIGDLLSSGVAVALSPIPIIAIVMVLDTPRARTSGPAFALGWILGLTVVSVLVVLLLADADDSGSAAETSVSWGEVAIGLLFLGMAAQQWRKRPEAGRPAETPKWMATLGSVTPARATGLGLALSGANPKNLALTLAAAASIAEAGLDGTDTALAVAAFVAVGSITVAGSVILYLIDAERAAQPLATVKRFMSDHNTVIMMVILLLLGAKLLGNGLGGLWD